MRILTDINNDEIHLERITGEDVYAGVIEATPYMVRQYRVTDAKKQLATLGCYFYGLADLESDLETAGSNSDIWPTPERWEAKLVKGSNVLYVMWYQEGGDPIEYLRTIVSGINFKERAVRKEEQDAFD